MPQEVETEPLWNQLLASLRGKDKSWRTPLLIAISTRFGMGCIANLYGVRSTFLSYLKAIPL
jgi:hypothetical protein